MLHLPLPATQTGSRVKLKASRKHQDYPAKLLNGQVDSTERYAAPSTAMKFNDSCTTIRTRGYFRV